jgi:UDP-N-acetylglucosamine acyltransferase
MSRSELVTMRAAYRMLFSPDGTLAENVGKVRRAFPDSAAVADILDFLTSRGKRQFTVPALGGRSEDAGDGAQ